MYFFTVFKLYKQNFKNFKLKLVNETESQYITVNEL